MKFCPKCGAVLVKKTKNFGCPRCSYSTKERVKISSSEKLSEKKSVAVIKDRDTQPLPVTTATCRKCKNKEAYFWTVQTRSGDEAETKFFRCTNPKCEYTWREYR